MSHPHPTHCFFGNSPAIVSPSSPSVLFFPVLSSGNCISSYLISSYPILFGLSCYPPPLLLCDSLLIFSLVSQTFLLFLILPFSHVILFPNPHLSPSPPQSVFLSLPSSLPHFNPSFHPNSTHVSLIVGCKVYFENRTDSPPYDSPAFTAFVNSKNSMNIRVNKPPSEKYDFPLLIDTRWKIEKLREVIAEEIGLSPGDLRMFKGEAKQNKYSRVKGLNVYYYHVFLSPFDRFSDNTAVMLYILPCPPLHTH